MSNTQMTVFGIGFIFIMTALGAALVYCFSGKVSAKLHALFLGFTAGIMLAASVWSLLLPALEEGENGWGRYACIPVCVGFLLGSGFLTLLDKLLPENLWFGANVSVPQHIRRLFLSVTLHNIPEGLAVGFAFGAAFSLGSSGAYATALGLAIGIGIQNFPEGAAVALPMKVPLKSKNKAFLCGVASGVAEPLFAVLGYFLAAQLRFLQPWLLAFAAGAMVFVVAEDILPKAQSENPTAGAWSVVVGFLVMMALDVIFG